MQKKFCFILFLLIFSACGKKSGLTYPPHGQDKPDYRKVLEGGKQ